MYSDLKRKECEWLSSFHPELPEHTTFDPFRTKFALMKKLKAQMILEQSNSITLIHPPVQNFTGKKISYNYQRQDFSVTGTPLLETYYPGLSTKAHVSGSFTKSGQAALFGLLLALRNHDKNFSLKPLAPMVYFESRSAIKGLGIPNDQKGTTLFLDSSALTQAPLLYLKGQEISRLIVDTTNWNINSENIQALIDWAGDNSCELFLVRSHIKLDCLGAEYGLLGSVVRISSYEDAKWTSHLRETLAYVGCIATHEDIYPFLWDETFLKLTEDRTERIRSNTKFLAGKLAPFLKIENQSLRIESFEHALYLGVVFKGNPEVHPDKFLKLSYVHQIPAKYCNSFGFDFVSLTNFVFVNQNSDEICLRICPGDNSDHQIALLKFIQDYLTFFGR